MANDASLPILFFQSPENIDIATEYVTATLLALVQKHQAEYGLCVYISTNNPFEPPSGKTPSLPLDQYVHRILQYAGIKQINLGGVASTVKHMCNHIVYLIDVIAKETGGADRATSTSIYRLFAAAFMFYDKCWSDQFFTNKYYAKIFGVPVGHLFLIEMNFVAASGCRMPTDLKKDYAESRCNVYTIPPISDETILVLSSTTPF